jgi:GT2 family glycosyltransferase
VRETIRSIKDQVYRHTKIIALAGENMAPDVAGDIEVKKPADPGFFRSLECDYVTFLLPGDRLDPTALYQVASAINRSNRQVDLVYFDDHRLRPPENLEPHRPFHKPDWSPDYLESLNYIGRGGVYRCKAIVERELSFDSLYDFLLRFTETDGEIVHLPEVLLALPDNRSSDASVHQTDIEALQGRLQRTGRKGTVTIVSQTENIYRIDLADRHRPLVSCVIPTAGRIVAIDGREVDLIKNVVENLIEKTNYKNIEIIIVDNNDLSDEQILFLDHHKCRRISYFERRFNVATKLNMGVAEAKGEFILLLNDDIEAIEPDWLDRMLDQAVKPGVGAVGALLLYPNGRIQHAGVVHDNGLPAHVCRGGSIHEDYFGSISGVRNFMAVTGACMLTPTECYRRAGGFSEEFAVSYNDVDYCLKLADLGYRIVYTPHAKLTHMESMSRGALADLDEAALFQKRWANRVTRDAFHNERFLRTQPSTYEPRINRRKL